MKTLLVAAAVLGFGVSGAMAECAGHTADNKKTQTTASLDMSTTASTIADDVKTSKETDKAK